LKLEFLKIENSYYGIKYSTLPHICHMLIMCYTKLQCCRIICD